MSKNKIIMYRQTWPWMDSISGFDPLCVEIEKQWSGEVANFWQPFKSGPLHPLERLKNRFSKVARGAGYHFPSNQPGHEKTAVKLLRYAERNPDALILLSVADDQFGAVLSKAPPSVRSRIVAFYHQPPSRLRLYFRHPERLKGLKAIVCLSEFHAEYFREITDTPAYCMLLGVRHDCFKPNPEKRSPTPKVVMVGHWLRDIPTLTAACESLVQKIPDIEFNYVIPRRIRKDADLLPLARLPQVRWHADLSGEELIELYQTAWIHLLPVIDASGNTAIVDTLASGLPVVSTNVGGLPDYVDPACGILCQPADAQDHAKAVLKLCQNPDERQAMSLAARKFAEKKLDWPSLASELMTYLKDL